MNKLRAVLCGYYGMGNGGDEALLASLLQMLLPEIEPIVCRATLSRPAIATRWQAAIASLSYPLFKHCVGQMFLSGAAAA